MIIINIVLVIGAFFFMEFVAWSNHKYVMHGFLWKWHKDHHRKDRKVYLPEKTEDKKFEKNDYFFIVYALPAIVFMILGLSLSIFPIVSISIGITLYGFTYFVIHDLVIHKRLNVPFLFRNHNFYTKAIIRAHIAHHWPKNKKDFHNYGLLIFPLRYFKE
jgi:beta-carotene 3-hydroxylase